MIETVLVFGIIIGIQIHDALFSIAVFSVIALYLFDKRKKAKQVKFIKDVIKAQWGKENIENRDSSQINSLYEYLLKNNEPEFYIDDITWRDLNMDTVFSKIDHTRSLPGMQYLYKVLRIPLFKKDNI